MTDIPNWIGGLIVTVSIGIFLDYFRMKVILTRIDWQLGRIASDRESEKATMVRVHSDFESRLRALEKHNS